MANFEYYVLNASHYSDGKMEYFNIFDNYEVAKGTEEAIEKYLKDPEHYCYNCYYAPPVYGFDGLCEEIEHLIKWQMWGRCEYEILIRGLFGNVMEKWDCYRQCKPNIRAIVRECLYQYTHQEEVLDDSKECP